MKILSKSKLSNVGTNVFTKMSSLATSCKAINLSQGYPDFGVDEKLIKLVKKYIDLGSNFNNEDQSKEIVIKDLCIGCGKCSNICPKDNIISYRHNARALKKLLPE